MTKMFLVGMTILFAVLGMAGSAWAVDVAITSVDESGKSVANKIFTGHVLGTDGKPIAGAKVVFKWLETGSPVFSDKDGLFKCPLPSFVRFQKGTGFFFFFEASYPDKPGLRGMLGKIIEEDKDLEGDIVLAPSGIFRGKVLDKDEKPVPFAKVSTMIYTDCGMEDCKGNCDAMGQFEIKNIAAGWRYTLTATADKYGHAQVDEIVVEPGETRDFGPLILPVADKFIDGMIKDEEGKPVAGVELTCGGKETGVRTTKSDAKGHYRFENIVVDDTVDIFAESNGPKGKLYAHVTATACDTNVEVTLKEPTRRHTSEDDQVVSMVGKEAPALDVATWISGEATTLESLHGAPVVLAFCKSEDKATEALLVLLNQIGKKFPKIPVLALYNANADQAVLKKTIESSGVKFRVAIDKADATTKKYNARVPAVYLISADGKVRYQDLALSTVEKALQSMLDGK